MTYYFHRDSEVHTLSYLTRERSCVWQWSEVTWHHKRCATSGLYSYYTHSYFTFI